MAEVVGLVPRPTNEGLIKGLEELLEKAKDGTIEALAYVALRPDQKFEVRKIGYCSNLEMAGALAFAQHDLMRDQK